MKNGRYNVLIVEDQAMPAQLFKHFIETSDNYKLVDCINCASFAELYCVSKPIDLILMDVVTADGASGLEAANKIKKKYPKIKIIIVTSMPECSYIKRAKKIGVEGFWYKETNNDCILSVMNKVMEGQIIYPDKPLKVNVGLAKSNEFTDKELIVLRYITGGYSNQEIADKLEVSLSAIKKHISNMLNKTGFRSRTELAVRAREIGIVILDRDENDV